MNEKSREASRRYYAKHRVKILEKYKVVRRKATDLWQARNPEKMREAHLRRQYGVSLPEFLEIRHRQNGVCAICKQEAAKCVDHNHKTGKVRALLCRKCNSGLGQFKEDFSILIRAADYIRRHEGLGVT